jgi:hypothetical protein
MQRRWGIVLHGIWTPAVRKLIIIKEVKLVLHPVLHQKDPKMWQELSILSQSEHVAPANGVWPERST